LALNIIGRIVVVALPYPMSVVTGDWFCKWSALPGKPEISIKPCT